MKDIQSSLGGSTYPADPEHSGDRIKGVVVRNKGPYGRRIAILTKDTSITAGTNAHAADYAYEPLPVTELPAGYVAGVEVELSAGRTYHEVFTVGGFFPFNHIKNLAALGHPELTTVGEMSNKVVGDTSNDVLLGQSVSTSELRQIDGALGNYFFSLSLQNRGKVYHLSFDGLKHPARLSADLNYQLRKVLPGVSGYFKATQGESASTQNGTKFNKVMLTLYLSVKPEVGNVQIMAYRISNYDTIKDLGDSYLPSTPMHINCELSSHYTINAEGVTVEENPEDFITTYFDEVIPSLDDILATKVTLMSPGELTTKEDHFLWEPIIPASSFKSYPADPRFRIAILQLNHPSTLGLFGLNVGDAVYKLLSGDRPVDFLPIGQEFTDRLKPGTIFGGDLSLNAPVLRYAANGLPMKETVWQFGELGGNANRVALKRALPQHPNYIAVIAPPEDLNGTPLFREPKDVTLSIKLMKTVYDEHVIATPPSVDKTWDEIYQTLDTAVPFPALTGTFAEGAELISYRSYIGENTIGNSTPTFTAEGAVNTNVALTYQQLLDRWGYDNSFAFQGELLSGYIKDTLVLGFTNVHSYAMTLTYPPTALQLVDFPEIVYLTGNPSTNFDIPYMVRGGIAGGFAGASLKHASTVEWEFNIIDGELITPVDPTGIPIAGALTNEFSFQLDKSILEGLIPADDLFFNIKLTVRYPWKVSPVVATIAVPINISVYVPSEDDGESKVTEITATLPDNAVGVQIYDADTGQVLLTIEDLEGLNTGTYWNAMDAAGIYLSYSGNDEIEE